MNLDRISVNPDRMNGQPCIRNLRLTVRRVVELADADIQQALLYAASYLDDRIIELPLKRVTAP